MMARTYVVGDGSLSNKLHLPSGNNVALNAYNQLLLTTCNEGSQDSSILFQPRGTTRMAISASGNIGIGTTTPGVALEVIGSISGSSTSTGSFGSLVLGGAMSSLSVGQAGLPGKLHVDTDFRVCSWS